MKNPSVTKDLRKQGRENIETFAISELQVLPKSPTDIPRAEETLKKREHRQTVGHCLERRCKVLIAESECIAGASAVSVIWEKKPADMAV